MAEYVVDIGPIYGAYTWDTSDMEESGFPTTSYPSDTDDDTLNTFYGLRTTARVAFLGLDITGGDSDDPLVFNNNTPIKWKTTSGAKRHMLKLNSNDYFVIGNNDADANDEIRFDISGVNDVVRFTNTGIIFANSQAILGSAADTDLLTLGNGLLTIAGDLVGDSSFNIGPTGDADLLVLASGLLTINGDLVGDSSFNIGPTGDADLLILASGLLTINGDLVGDSSFTIGPSGNTTLLTLATSLLTVSGADISGGSGSFQFAQISGTVGGFIFASSKNVGNFAVLGATSARLHLEDSGGTANQRIFQLQCDSPSVLFVKRTDVGGSTTMLTLDLNTGNATFAFDVAVNGGDITSSSSTFNFLTATVTTFTALQAMTSGSWGATTGSTRFRHDIYIGDGSGAQFLEISGGAANRDLIWSNNDSDRWRARVDSSEDWRLYRSADGSTFYQVMYLDNSDGNGYFGTEERWAFDSVGRLKNKTLDHDVTCFFFEDFTYSSVTAGEAGGMACWDITNTGGSNLIEIVDAANGIIRMYTENVASKYMAITLGSRTYSINPVAWNGYPVILEFRAKNASTATNGVQTCGLRSNSASFYAYFHKDENNSGNWVCKSKNFLATENSTNTSSSSTSYHIFQIVIESASSLKFYIDGTLVATHTTNLPAGNMCIDFYSGYNNNNSTRSDLYVDYAKLTFARN